MRERTEVGTRVGVGMNGGELGRADVGGWVA